MNIELEEKLTEALAGKKKEIEELNHAIEGIEKEFKFALPEEMEAEGFKFGYSAVEIEMVKGGSNYRRKFISLSDKDKIAVLKLIQQRLKFRLEQLYLKRKVLAQDYKDLLLDAE